MELILIRHTQTAFAPGICYGLTDVPLAAEADADIQLTLARVPRSELLFTSPAQRCQRLAQALAQRDRCQSRVASELLELNFGLWEGKPWTQIQREESELWAEDPWNRAPPGGETECALWQRVAAWYERELRASAATRATIVAHGGPLRALRCFALGLAPADRWHWTLAMGEVALIALTAAIPAPIVLPQR